MLLAVPTAASEAELVIRDLASVDFMGVSGHNLLLVGLLICVRGMVFGLLAVELAITLDPTLSRFLAAAFFLASVVFVDRSFYNMRIPRH